MDSINNFGTFVFSCLLLNLTPGSDTILTLTKSIAQGKKAGVLTALGIGAGIVVHTIFAAFGLSLIISQSITLFNVIKYAGALYLIYLGVRMIAAKSGFHIEERNKTKAESPLVLLRDGFFSNVLNPKVALFFIAFLPQFVNPAYKGGAMPFIFLGLTFTTTGVIYCSCLAIFAAHLFKNLRENANFSSWLNKACGSALIGLGAYVAFLRR